MDVEKTEEQTTDKDDTGDFKSEQQNAEKDAESDDNVVSREENSDLESEGINVQYYYSLYRLDFTQVYVLIFALMDIWFR